MLKNNNFNKNKTYLQTERTGRFFTLGQLNEKTEFIWFVLHGYGQLANYFIEKFAVISDVKNFIVAPEALNRFYLKGFSGRIGATWMTKEEREHEIHDYVKFLNSVYEQIRDNIDLQKIKINLLGFSQGAHTAVRWLLKGNIQPENLILWSGSFPADNEIAENIDLLNATKIFMVIGNKDEFIDEKSINVEEKRLLSLGLKYGLIPFDGGHEIEKETLLNLSRKLEGGE